MHSGNCIIRLGSWEPVSQRPTHIYGDSVVNNTHKPDLLLQNNNNAVF